MYSRTIITRGWRLFGAVLLGRCGFGVIRHRRVLPRQRGVLALQLGLVYFEANWARIDE